MKAWTYRRIILTLFFVTLYPVFTVRAQDNAQPPTPRIIHKSGGVLQSSAIQKVEPVYPPLAKAAAISGTVVVEVIIDGEGNVISASAISGHPLLKDAALDAARGWKFTPIRLSGVPVKVVGTITFNFVMDGGHERSYIDTLKDEILNNPNSAEAHYKLGKTYAVLEQFSEAIEELQKAVRLNPEFAEAYFVLGGTCFQSGKYADAADAFVQTIRTNPKLIDAQFGLGICYAKMGRSEDSIKTIKQAMLNNPTFPGGYLALGMAYAYLNRHKEAIETLKQGIDRNLRDSALHFALGEVHSSLQQHARAIAAYKQAISVSRFTFAKAHLSLGLSYLKIGDRRSAIKQYEILKDAYADMAEALLKEIDK